MGKGQPPDRLAAIDDESSLSPEESLGLVEADGTKAARSLHVHPAPILAAWGLAWMIGFGAVYLTSRDGLGLVLPAWVAAVVLVVLFAVAVAVSFGEQARRGRGVEGPSQRVAAMYAWSWLLAFAALFAVDLGLAHQGVPAHLQPLLWTGSSLLAVGLLYLAGGMLWGDRLQYALGAWVLVVGAASVAAGVPQNFAVLSLAGGGGFLVAAALAQARDRSAGRAQG
jgi:hypothetical protein